MLKVDYLRDSSAGPLNTGVVSMTGQRCLNRNEPFLLQIHEEIQQMILSYLEPIWVLQVEAAFPEIAGLSSISNLMWYNSLPPALFTEPEHFQNESQIDRTSQLITLEAGANR